MKIIRSQCHLFFALITVIVMLLSVHSARADYAILHNFGGSGDGREPWGSLTVSGSTLYGMTRDGGSNGHGTLFKMNTDGTGYTILHNFGDFSDDGISPHGNLILSGSTLYGATRGGGIYGGDGAWWGGWYGGTLFKINTDGTGYTILHNFGDNGDVLDVYSSPILSGSTLYGVTPHGGSYGWWAGTLYKINTDGTGYSILRNLVPGSSEGSRPYDSPILSGSTLYGVTVDGGSYWWWGAGVLFKMNTDGTGYTILHNFGDSGDGHNPFGSPILSGSVLYGTTYYGGSYGAWGPGTLFKMNTDGTGYTILHNFGDSGDGHNPYGSPILSGSTLYGMTLGGGNYGGWQWWGGYGAGTIFKMNTDGTGYTILHNFGNSGDGYEPRGNLILSGSTIYGMTSGGGSNGGGVLFKYTLSETAPSTPAEVINTVDAMLASGEITSAATANTIISQLSNAQEKIVTNPTSAANMLNAVINFIEAQSGKKITTESAETLIKYLTGILAGL